MYVNYRFEHELTSLKYFGVYLHKFPTCNYIDVRSFFANVRTNFTCMEVCQSTYKALISYIDGNLANMARYYRNKIRAVTKNCLTKNLVNVHQVYVCIV